MQQSTCFAIVIAAVAGVPAAQAWSSNEGHYGLHDPAAVAAIAIAAAAATCNPAEWQSVDQLISPQDNKLLILFSAVRNPTLPFFLCFVVIITHIFSGPTP